MATPDVRKLFVDTNVLVYANVAEAPHHEAALHHMNTAHAAGTELWLSVQVLREYLAVLSRPQTFGRRTNPHELVGMVRSFLALFHLAQETTPTLEKLLSLVEQYDVRGKQVHDANIVATMLTGNITHLLTCNTKDFERFSPLITIVGLA
ncbi:MAG: PIN domain-containing protein [Lentisphaerae bacterium]|nr:PIN domain-containing protein [Lentisphaerota bacterium]